MRNFALAWMKVLLAAALFAGVLTVPGAAWAQPHAGGVSSRAKPAEIQILHSPIPIRVLAESPADTDTELQAVCLFESTPSNTLHGSLHEIDERMKGLLTQIRKPDLFRGELGETILIEPPAGSLKARKLLIVGLGDSQTFTPARMDLVGAILYREASRLGIAHPYFAPTILDGGVAKFGTGEVAAQVVSGFLRAARTEKELTRSGRSQGKTVQRLTYLAGAAHASDTQHGIEKAIAAVP